MKGQHLPLLNSVLKGVGSAQAKTQGVDRQRLCFKWPLLSFLASSQHVSRIKFGDPRSSGSVSEQKHAYSAPAQRTHRYQQENLMGTSRSGSCWGTSRSAAQSWCLAEPTTRSVLPPRPSTRTCS